LKFPEWVKNFGKFLVRIFFPAHHRKVTNTVIAVGAALVLDSYLLNGLIAWALQLLMASFTNTEPPAWSETDSNLGIWAGVILIGMSLLYSFAVHAVEMTAEKSIRAEAESTRSAEMSQRQAVLRRDFRIYRDVLKVFGTGTRLAYFLSQHNFGGSYPSNLNSEMGQFVDKWSAPERQFQTSEIATPFTSMRETMLELADHLAAQGGYLRANHNLYCIFDPSIHHDFDVPKHVSEAIDRANELSALADKQRQAFIEVAERHFAVLFGQADATDRS
jgi:hypothetical protein